MPSPNLTLKLPLFFPSFVVIHTFIRDENTIKNVSPLNKCVLIAVEHFVKNCTIGEDFRDNFVRDGYEANGSKIFYTSSRNLL